MHNQQYYKHKIKQITHRANTTNIHRKLELRHKPKVRQGAPEGISGLASPPEVR